MTLQEDPLAGVEAARAKIDALVAEAEARKDGFGHLAEELKAVSATARSPQGEVTVVAQPSGRIVAVQFTEAAERLRASQLSHLVSETIASAQHQAALAALKLSGPVFGEESLAFDQMRSEALAVFPGPGDQDPHTIGYR